MVHMSMFQGTPEPMREVDWLNAAAEVVRAYCGWHVVPVLTETLVLDEPEGDALLLPSNHVTGVLDVKVHGVALDRDSYEWAEDGRLRIHRGSFGGCGRRPRLRGVEVTLTHGYTEEEAASVLAVVRGVAARAAMSPGGNVASQAAGTQRVQFASLSGGGSNSLPLMQTEKSTLDSYKLEWGPR